MLVSYYYFFFEIKSHAKGVFQGAGSERQTVFSKAWICCAENLNGLG